MNLLRTSLVSVLVALGASSAQAITVDGQYESAYGSPTAVITYSGDDANPNGNFGSPTMTASAGYKIYLNNSGGTLYGLLIADGTGQIVAPFANLYFGKPSPIGSTIGFEIANQNAFVPGVPNSGISVPITYASTANSFEFAIPDSYFYTTLTGILTSDPTHTQSGSVTAGYNIGDTIQLRLSQSFSYSVAGDPNNPLNLGSFTLQAAVPEPSTWAMKILGFAGVGFVSYRRRKQTVEFGAA